MLRYEDIKKPSGLKKTKKLSVPSSKLGVPTKKVGTPTQKLRVPTSEQGSTYQKGR